MIINAKLHLRKPLFDIHLHFFDTKLPYLGFNGLFGEMYTGNVTFEVTSRLSTINVSVCVLFLFNIEH